MTSSLMGRPAMPIEAGHLSNELKRTISRRLWDTDGSCGHGQATISADDMAYVEGLRDAGVKGADELLKIIKKHGAIIVWHEH